MDKPEKKKKDEPEIYALNKNEHHKFERRDFIKGLGILSGASIVACSGEMKSKIDGESENIFRENKYQPDTIDAESCSGLVAHSGYVNSIHFNPNGKILASGSSDKTIKLWSTTSGKLLKTLEDHTAKVYAVNFSPDGKIIASGSYDDTIKLWSIPDGQLLNTLDGHSSTVYSVNFNPDGKMLASGSSDDTIKLWSVPDGQLLKTFEGHTDTVNSVQFSPDGNILASGSADYTIKLWSVPDGQLLKTFEDHSYDVNSVHFSPDGKFLASGSSDETIKLWSIPDGKLLKTLTKHNDNVKSVQFSPDGKNLVSGSADDTIKIWSIPDGQLLKTLEGHTFDVNSASYSPDGNKLASGSSDKTIKLWEWAAYTDIEPDYSYEEFTGAMSPVFHINENYIIGKERNKNKLILIDITKKGITHKISGNFRNAATVFLSDDSNYAMVGDENGIIQWCKVNDANIQGNFEAHIGNINQLFLTQTNSLLITAANDGKVKLWDFPEGKIKSEFDGSLFSVSDDEKLFCVFNSESSTIVIHALHDLSVIKTIELQIEIKAISFIPGKNYLAIGTNNKCTIYDFKLEKYVATFHNNGDYPVVSLSSNKKGNILIFAYSNEYMNGFCVVDLEADIKLKEVSMDYANNIFPKCMIVESEGADKMIYINDTIRIYSITDYKEDVMLYNCLYDKDELEEETKGIKYTVGSTTSTLPCGSPIPAGALCTCNCVRVGSRKTYYSNPSNTYYTSYWYPN